MKEFNGRWFLVGVLLAIVYGMFLYYGEQVNRPLKATDFKVSPPVRVE